MTYVRWVRRAGSYLIDYAILVPLAILGAMSPTPVAVACTFVNLALLAANRWVLAGRTGQSLGRRIVGTRLVDEGTGEPIGAVRAFARDICHLLDWLLIGIGWLRPLWQRRRQTFADSIAMTAVIPDRA